MVWQQAALHARKLFAARTAVNIAFADIDDVSMSAQQHGESVAARNALLAGLTRTSTRTEAGAGNGERLDHYLERQDRTRLAGMILNSRTAADEGLLQRLTAVSKRYNTLDCKVCAANAPGGIPPCCAEPEDDIVVSHGGECIRELTDMFESALAFISHEYATAVGSGATIDLRRAKYSLATTSTPTGPVTAATTFVQGTPHESVVRLSFPEDTESERLAEIPYVLAHEIASHAFYSTLLPKPREQRGSADEWAEAWMDCVAFSLLRDRLNQGLPVTRMKPLPFTRESLVNATHQYHAWRYKVTAAPPPGGSALREAKGRFKAMECRILRCMGPDALRVTLQSLLILNARGAPPEVTNVLIASSMAFREGLNLEQDVLTPDEERIWGGLARYCDHQTEVALLADLTI